MAWIKTHPHLVVLILVAVGVLAVSGLLVSRAGAFDTKFDPVRQKVPKGTKVYEQAQDEIEAAKAEFKSPTVWTPPKDRTFVFVSDLYKPNETGDALVKPERETKIDSFTGKPIPYKWFKDHNLNFYDKNITRQDADGDGFWNEDEWRFNTDPNNKDSHPPYVSKLFFVKVIKVPFLLRFQGIDGDPEKDKPETLKFQLNTLSLRQPTLFLGIGEQVTGTKFKIQKFEFKKNVIDPNGLEHEASELTLINTETNEPTVLVVGKITDSPDYYGQFRYLLNAPPRDIITVKRFQQFILLPEKDQFYKLLDISEDKALIQTPSGEKLDIPKLPPGYP